MWKRSIVLLRWRRDTERLELHLSRVPQAAERALRDDADQLRPYDGRRIGRHPACVGIGCAPGVDQGFAVEVVLQTSVLIFSMNITRRAAPHS